MHLKAKKQLSQDTEAMQTCDKNIHVLDFEHCKSGGFNNFFKLMLMADGLLASKINYYDRKIVK